VAAGYFESYLHAPASSGSGHATEFRAQPAEPGTGANVAAAAPATAGAVSAPSTPEKLAAPAAAMQLTRAPASVAADGTPAALPVTAEATFTLPPYCVQHVINGTPCV